MIKTLNEQQITQIKSNSEINDLAECVIQLIFNSIDAESTLIQVQLDLDKYSCIVSDNGKGLNESDINLIGQRYATNKSNSIDDIKGLKTYGYHGESLSNIITLCDQFDLITKTENYFFHKQFKNDSCTINKLMNIDAKYKNLTTIVRVENLFGKNILRQHQLKQQSKATLRIFLNYIDGLFLYHFTIDFLIRNSNENQILFQSKRANSLTNKFSSQIKLNQTYLKRYSFTQNDFMINGLFSLMNKDDKQIEKHQYIYVNRHFIFNKDIYNFVSKELVSCKRLNFLRTNQNNLIYFIAIETSKHEILFLKKNNKIIVEFENDLIYDVLKRFIHSFLIENGFITKEDELDIKELILDTKEYEFKNVRISKVIKNKISNEVLEKNINDSSKRKINLLGISPVNKIGKKKPFSRLKSIFKSEFLIKSKTKSTQTDQNDFVKLNLKPNWIAQLDPNGVEFYLNILDGTTTFDLNQVKLDKINYDDQLEKLLNGFDSDLIVSNNIESKTDLNQLFIEKMVLVKWRNIDEFKALKKNLNCGSLEDLTNFKIDKYLFDGLKTLGQFDNKFIISYKLNELNGKKLYSMFIFDQHAVHERIRLESLYKENYDLKNAQIISKKLSAPLKFQTKPIKDDEFEVFNKYMFKLGFDLRQTIQANETIIEVYKIPNILSFKFKYLDQKEAIIDISNIIESQLKKLHTFKSKSNKFNLLEMPNELLDAFNLVACRNAIKFGDSLSKEICKTMLNNLSKVAHPFYCAHGRPTVLPLINVFTKQEKKFKPNFKNLFLN